MRMRRVGGAVAFGLAASLVVAGCSSDGDSGSGTESTEGESSGESGEVVTIDFWSWPEGTDKTVEEFNATHDDVQVNYTNAGGGDESSAKLLTAVRSGDAPDVVLVEYTTLPSMIVGGAVMDISEQVDEDLKGAFSTGAWEQTTFDGAIYGVPQDVGPAAMVYNAAVFDELGIEAPQTWDDFRAAAAVIQESNPDATIGAYPPSELGFWASAAAINGSEWWSYEGDAWAVNIGDEASQEVATFFEEMANDGLITTESLLTAEYNARINANEMLSWTAALWATGVVQGVADENQLGNWRLGRFPQWDASSTAVGYQGGSAAIITSSSEKVDAAMEFIEWLNASEEGAAALIENSGPYPASTVGQQLTTELDPPALASGQEDYYDLAADIASDTIGVSWGPNVAYAKTVLEEELGRAIQNGTSWADAFVATGEAVKKDLANQGYQVAN